MDAPGGPIQVQLQQEAEKKQWLRERRSTSTLTSTKRRSREEVPGESYAQPTFASQIRKSQVLGEDTFDDGSATVASIELERSAHWNDFHRRSSAFLDERKQLLDSLRKQKELDELQACTFEPQLVTAKTPRGGAEGKPRSKSSTSAAAAVYDRSRAQEERKAARVEKLRQELDAKEMGPCSFHPNTNSGRCRRTVTSASLRHPSTPAPIMSAAVAAPVPTYEAALENNWRANGFSFAAPPRMSYKAFLMSSSAPMPGVRDGTNQAQTRGL